MVKTMLRNIKEKVKLALFTKEVGKGSFVERSVYVLGWSKVKIGKNSVIGENSWININNKNGDGPRLEIGDYCYIGPNAILSTGKKIIISDYFLCGHDCRLIGSNHIYDNPLKPYVSTGAYDIDIIEIEENVWMGLNVVVTGNLKIGRGSIISASSVVTKDIPPFSIAVGVPCRVIKRFSFTDKKWKDISVWTENDEKAILPRDKYKEELTKVKNISMPIRAATRHFGDLL